MKNLKLALIGAPISHSFSPYIYTEFAKHAGFQIKIDYEKFQTYERQYEKTVKFLISDGFTGCNITMPCKTIAANTADLKSVLCEKINCANTLKFENGKAMAFNTDGKGMTDAILSRIKQSLCGKNILLLGFGGAGRAIYHELQCRGSNITLLCRSGHKLNELQNSQSFHDLENLNNNLKIQELTQNNLECNIEKCDIFINATPLGMTSFPDFADLTFLKKAREDLLICDAVYTPIKTSLLKKASDHGLCTLGGIYMLVNQAAHAWQIWTDSFPDKEVIENTILTLSKQFGEI